MIAEAKLCSVTGTCVIGLIWGHVGAQTSALQCGGVPLVGGGGEASQAPLQAAGLCSGVPFGEGKAVKPVVLCLFLLLFWQRRRERLLERASRAASPRERGEGQRDG